MDARSTRGRRRFLPDGGADRMQRLRKRHGFRGRLARFGRSYPHCRRNGLPNTGAGRRHVLVHTHAAARLFAAARDGRPGGRIAQCIRYARRMGPRAHGRLSQRDLAMASNLHHVYRAAGFGRLSTTRAYNQSADAHAVQHADAIAAADANAIAHAAADAHTAAIVRSALRNALKRGPIVGFEQVEQVRILTA